MRRCFFIVAMFAALLFVACATNQSAPPNKATTKTSEQHPALSQQQKFIPCSKCHKTVTPDIYSEWFKSYHGLDNVKCFQCHGTFSDFHVTPPIIKCEACHAKEVETLTSKKACWDCHSPHSFKHSPNTPKGHK